MRKELQWIRILEAEADDAIMTDQRWVAHLSDPPDEEDKTIASESSLHAALVGVMNPMPVDQVINSPNNEGNNLEL